MEKAKKIGNGFGFRLAQAIIYTFIATVFLVVSFVMLGLREKSMIKWMGNYAEKYYHDSFQVYLYDNSYDDYDNYLLVDSDTPYIRARIEGGSEDHRYDYLYFVSEDVNAQTVTFKSKDTGKILTVSYSDISYHESFFEDNEIYVILFSIFVGLGAAMTIWTIAQFVVAFKGKKSIAANKASIGINFLFALFGGIGLAGLVGGLKGKWTLLYGADCHGLQSRGTGGLSSSEDSEPAEEYSAVNSMDSATESVEDEATASDEPVLEKGVAQIEEVERVQPKIGANGKKGIMITLIVSYSLLLLAGILLAAIPGASKIISGMGICEEISARAYAITIGVMWVALVPTFGYYFVTVAPLKISKKVKIIIAVVTSVLLVAMNAVFFIVINAVKIEDIIPVKEFFEDSDSWFIPLSMVFASLGTVICYALTLFRGNSASIKGINTEVEGDGASSKVKGVLLKIVNGLLIAVRFVLYVKEKYPDIFVLVVTLLMTWLAFFTAFIFAIVCIVLLIVVIILYFCKAYDFVKGDVSPDMKEYSFINDMGCRQMVYSRDGKTFYTSQGEYVGKSDGIGRIITG